MGRLLPGLALGCALSACSAGKPDEGSPDGGGQDGGLPGDGGQDGGGQGDGGQGDGGQGDGGGSDGGSDGGGSDGGLGDGGGSDGGGSDGGGSDGGGTDLRCALGHDLASPWFSEGDWIEFHVFCTGDLATEAAEIEALGLPDGASWNADEGLLRWHTGAASGGRYDLQFSARPRDSAGTIPEGATVTLWVADSPLVPGAVPPDPATYTEEWGLPVLHVQSSSTITTSYVPATLHWGREELSATIKIRGASSAYYPKPSYTIELDHEEITLPWGDDSRDHLILLTTFDDNSYVRQKLVYDQWAAIAEYWGVDRLTPRSFFLVVYLDGIYHGLYVGLDRIDDEFVRQMGFEDSGNLYKAVNHDANFYLTNSSGAAKTSLSEGYTKEEGEPETDMRDLEALVEFTGGSEDAELLADAESWFSLAEFMDWALLVQYGICEDSAGKNSYLYHDPSSGTFRYAPWDFNHSWGQGWYTYRIGSSAINEFMGANRVFAAIQRDPVTDAVLWERFRAMREDGPYQTDWLLDQLDAYYAEIQPSAARDWEVWGDDYRSYGGWSRARSAAGDWTDFEGEKTYLYTWIEERGALYESLVP